MRGLLNSTYVAFKQYIATRRASQVVACAACFRNSGLRLAARSMGASDARKCPSCGSASDRKLTRAQLLQLAHRFFVWGSLQRLDYGAAPLLEFNTHRKSDIDVDPFLQDDLRVFESGIGVGFFYYGPRLWMIGEIEPLKALQSTKDRGAVLQRIVKEYPQALMQPNDEFFRIRLRPESPTNSSEYDSPPIHMVGAGRLDAVDFPVLYGSTDLEVCIHECRAVAEDEIFMATLRPTRELRVLDLSCLLEEDVTEFESLDLAVHMLFLARNHAYEHSRAIARAALEAGFDGVCYPSYYSLLRIGAMPFETVYGISVRKLPGAKAREKWKTIPNIALFGRPVEEGKVCVACINRLVLRRVSYQLEFGPAIDMEALRIKSRATVESIRDKLEATLAVDGAEFQNGNL